MSEQSGIEHVLDKHIATLRTMQVDIEKDVDEFENATFNAENVSVMYGRLSAEVTVLTRIMEAFMVVYKEHSS